ncbi:phenylalanine--tRNA ligase subunit beta [Stygiolobus caldivivus]|uniref:Phenylalanine--tRNA ligase beta subunit n=1 Tax=Stygiolobus caldivivus TaxID=2824673 RepID=A0A8D5ZK34_9CREN|nr:phenylalanine--tRNA ligase subunit beta [Stygiolobus caldivivus]BCU71311.1 phenylalanine--tRNA ligase subunit beta [Stygiolobus caldivivus]
MVNIIVYKWDLLNKLKISENELEDLLFNLKSEVKPVDQDHLEIEINNDRPDLLSTPGIIRAIKGLKKIELGEAKYEVKQGEYSLKVEKVETRPYAVAGIVRGINLDEDSLKELIQFQEKLHITIGRKRKKVAIGIHDLDKITSKNIVYREVQLDYKFTPLNEKRELTVKEVLESTEQGKQYGTISVKDGRTPAIMEDNGSILSIPPVINSEKTRLEISTRNLFIDVTGTSLDAVSATLDILTTNLAEMGGKIELVKVLSESYETWYPQLKHSKMKISSDYVSKKIGLNLTTESVIEYLRMARFDVSKVQGNEVEVIIPPYRVDIISQIDLVEDVAMMIGYQNLEPSSFKLTRLGAATKLTTVTRKIRDLSIGAGFTEIFTFVLTNDRDIEGDYVKIVNPVTVDYTVIRNSLIPTTLYFLKQNQHSKMPILVFEIGDAVIRGNTDTGYLNSTRAVYSIMDSKVSFEDLQSRIHQILYNLNISFEYRRAEHPLLIKGRTAEIIKDKEQVVGIIGEVHPQVLEKLGIEYPIVISEIYVDRLIGENL